MGSLMDTMLANFEVEDQDGFINAVDALIANPDNQEFLSIYINGEMAMTGAGEITLEQDDIVTFTLETWE